MVRTTCKACFPLGGILRAERHFPPKLCSSKVESSSTVLISRMENIAPPAKFRLVENGLKEAC